jgi:D-alanyl-D-alanine carboxypeptidase/D-alanyl-D-alanine carboxypeptidase (penicillin-binding protein 5/6)
MKRLSIFVLILFIFLSNTGIVFAQQPSLAAGSYILIDAKSGTVLCEKNSKQTHYPASLTKIMTAILAIEMGDPDQIMTASQSAIDGIGVNGSNIGIIPGEKISLEHLLQALLITSANETANIIAEHLGPSSEEFISLMNKRAKELGAVETHFANACGIHDPMHFTTAADMAKFARYAMTLPEFREIVSTHSFTMPATNKHPTWPVMSNTNKLMLTDKSEQYEINGIKTGYTGPAGHNLVSSAINSDGMELIAVVMAVKNEGAAENVRLYSKELLDYGFNNFEMVELLKKGKVYRNVKVENTDDIYGLDLITTADLSCVLPKDKSLRNIKEIQHINDTISAPVNKGDIMGYVEFFKDEISIGKIELVAARSLEHKPEPESLKTVVQKASDNIYVKIGLCVFGFILFFILLRITLRRISRKVNSSRHSRYH